jgi:hypothetical protein
VEISSEPAPTTATWIAVGVAWALVGIPLLWCVLNTFSKAIVLFE